MAAIRRTPIGFAAMKKIDCPNAGLLPDFNNFGRYDRYDGVTKCSTRPAVCAKALKFDTKAMKHVPITTGC